MVKTWIATRVGQVHIKSAIPYFILYLTSSLPEAGGQLHVPAALYPENLKQPTLLKKEIIWYENGDCNVSHNGAALKQDGA
jgi:hypothetical protein